MTSSDSATAGQCILSGTINIFGLRCKVRILRITVRTQTSGQQPQHPILSTVAPHMPHRPSSVRLLSSNLSVTPSPEGALYTPSLQALPHAARTSRLPSVARAQQQRRGQECDANAEGAVGRPSWRARRETVARGRYLRARRCPIQLWRSVPLEAREGQREVWGR